MVVATIDSAIASHRRGNQCDQMAKLFVQYLAIYINENVPNIEQKMCPLVLKNDKVDSKFCQTLNEH